MPSVLFVCTVNRYRSPLAAALFRKRLQDKRIPGSWIVESAGTWASTGLPALTSVSKVAQTYGLDLSSHRSIKIDESMISMYDLILVMEASHKEALQNEFPSYYEQIHLFSKVASGHSYDIPDLMGNDREIEKIGARLDELISMGADNICSLAARLHENRQLTR